ASIVGEVVPAHEFYDYEAKYLDEGSKLLIPAPVGEGTAEQARELAVRAFKAVDAAGMARVDFFLERGTGQLYVNELNTIPGFTRISMYPKLWEASGVSFQQLVARLIQLARGHSGQRRASPDCQRRRIGPGGGWQSEHLLARPLRPGAAGVGASLGAVSRGPGGAARPGRGPRHRVVTGGRASGG